MGNGGLAVVVDLDPGDVDVDIDFLVVSVELSKVFLGGDVALCVGVDGGVGIFGYDVVCPVGHGSDFVGGIFDFVYFLSEILDSWCKLFVDELAQIVCYLVF